MQGGKWASMNSYVLYIEEDAKEANTVLASVVGLIKS